MRKILLAAGAIGALLTVSACADTGYGYYGASETAVAAGCGVSMSMPTLS